jgi:hypothetical protein
VDCKSRSVLLRFGSFRYDLKSALFLLTSLAVALGSLNYYGTFRGLFVSVFLTSTLLILSRRWRLWRFVLLVHFAFVLLLFLACLWDLQRGGPYAQRYNFGLRDRALAANLLSSDEHLVEDELGPATLVYSDWSEIDARTGKPTSNAIITTTYKFAPYPVFPFDDTFEVHCRNGKVVSIELFDD